MSDIPKTYNYIYVACDTYRDISIKTVEKWKFQTSKKNLCNGENKERLFQLFEETWADEKKEDIGERHIYFARGNSCVKMTNQSVSRIEELNTDHEEADSKVSYLIQHAIDTYPEVSEVCIRSCSGDVDIPLILIGSFGCHTDTNIVVDNGTGKNRKKIRIDSSKLTQLQQQADDLHIQAEKFVCKMYN